VLTPPGKLRQRLQNSNTLANFPMFTPVRDLHMVFNPPYVYDYIIKLCKQQAKAVPRHETDHIRSIGQGEARHRKYKRLKLSGGQVIKQVM
jgi:hypothetical protein